MEMESTFWAREKGLRKDIEKRKYGVVQLEWDLVMEPPSRRECFKGKA